MADAKQNDKEVFVYEFDRNRNEKARARLFEYSGQVYADIRCYYSDDKGELRPDKERGCRQCR